MGAQVYFIEQKNKAMTGNALIHLFKYFFGLEKPNTQTSVNEQLCISKYAKNAKIIAEIGVFEGYNTKKMALSSSEEARIYAIDPFFKGKLGLNYGELIAWNEWRKSGIKHKIIVVKKLSFDATDDVSNELDFIFIDGDHSFEGVKKDFILYSHKISSHGYIAFHDARVFDNGWTEKDWGPVRLLDEIIRPSNEWKIVEEIDSLVIIQRKRPS